ncbi:response regulator receiver domain-containing protein [Roseimicrobium gellanilyticum]|uniref:Response regulator receiver domain-containing protein n=1 Tax=Roseimicrobium gellanilyticum TaxID=748857 RepID=A0A366HN24_9BACT|nr:response regulator [Roseimicrobium gellanilyticum]RBP44403.1 response regulator receiver domain-containing protein [Roseimicrobium gellanilyticum]
MNTPLQESPQPKTILLVEDNDSYRQIVAATLSKMLPDCQIVEADSVMTARTVAPVESLAVALLDMTLPDGMATDIIEGWQPYMKQGLKVVVFSSYEAEEVAPALQDLGVHQYVNKERGMKPLIQAVQAAVHSADPAEKNVQSAPGSPTMRTEGACHS